MSGIRALPVLLYFKQTKNLTRRSDTYQQPQALQRGDAGIISRGSVLEAWREKVEATVQRITAGVPCPLALFLATDVLLLLSWV